MVGPKSLGNPFRPRKVGRIVERLLFFFIGRKVPQEPVVVAERVESAVYRRLSERTVEAGHVYSLLYISNHLHDPFQLPQVRAVYQQGDLDVHGFPLFGVYVHFSVISLFLLFRPEADNLRWLFRTLIRRLVPEGAEGHEGASRGPRRAPEEEIKNCKTGRKHAAFACIRLAFYHRVISEGNEGKLRTRLKSKFPYTFINRRTEARSNQPGRGGDAEGFRSSSQRRAAAQEEAGKTQKAGSIVYRLEKVLIE